MTSYEILQLVVFSMRRTQRSVGNGFAEAIVGGGSSYPDLLGSWR
jgi:hypothetical protein